MGVAQCGHFSDKGELIFSQFCSDVFHGRVPYWKRNDRTLELNTKHSIPGQESDNVAKRIWINIGAKQGRRQKIFQRGKRKKDRKLAKKIPKITLFSLFQEGPTEKRPKNSKKGQKIALLSLYLRSLYQGGGPGGDHGPPAPRFRRPWSQVLNRERRQL